MKKAAALFLLCMAFLSANAQKENGTVYSDHEAIQKTRSAWEALFRGDKEAFTGFYADTVYVNVNGAISNQLNNKLSSRVDFWNQFEKKSFRDDKPATPDAIFYKEGGLWVQDWLRINATHKSTGYRIDLAIHTLYSFNKAGKIRAIIQYFNNDQFQAIQLAPLTIENGTVYKEHPHILTVRKAVNAYADEELDKLLSFYAPGARFFALAEKHGTFKDLAAKTEEWKSTFRDNSDMTFIQYGYPDAIYYAQGNIWQVFSWWRLSYTGSDGKKRSEIPVLLIHEFDKEGKITSESVNVSTNHFQ